MKTIAIEGGINWTWYCSFRQEGTKVRILHYWRLHNYDDHNHPVVNHNQSARIVEDANRTAISLRIRTRDQGLGLVSTTQTFEIINPQYIFSYGSPDIIKQQNASICASLTTV